MLNLIVYSIVDLIGNFIVNLMVNLIVNSMVNSTVNVMILSISSALQKRDIANGRSAEIVMNNASFFTLADSLNFFVYV